MFRDDLWAAEIVPGYDVPGWFILRARRHAERLTGLDDGELAAFARRARDLIASVTEVTCAPATYLLVFGENYPRVALTCSSMACAASRRPAELTRTGDKPGGARGDGIGETGPVRPKSLIVPNGPAVTPRPAATGPAGGPGRGR